MITHPASAASDVLDRLSHRQYTVRRKVFKLFGGAFHIFDAAGNVVLYSQMKAFKLKEDIRLYTGQDMQHEVLTIKARSIIDFGASYDVFDTATGLKLGALRRKGLKSMFKDEWLLLNETDQQIGVIREDSTFKALVRRFVELGALLLPQSYNVEMNGRQVARFKQNANPFVYKLSVDFTADQQMELDPRLGLAAAILMAAVEGKQSS